MGDTSVTLDEQLKALRARLSVVQKDLAESSNTSLSLGVLDEEPSREGTQSSSSSLPDQLAQPTPVQTPRACLSAAAASRTGSCDDVRTPAATPLRQHASCSRLNVDGPRAALSRDGASSRSVGHLPPAPAPVKLTPASATADALSLPPPVVRVTDENCPPLTPGEQQRQCIRVNGLDYQLLNLLGKGGSSKVYQVYDGRRAACLAVKVVELADAEDAVRDAYANEIALLERLQASDRVVKLFDYERRDAEERLYVVMEKGDTDLASFLKGRRHEQLSDKLVAFYWLEMLRAVRVIHEHGIVHSDLKPSNFLLVGGNLKLIDFGIASAVPSNKTSVTKDCQMGTLNYMAPEAINSASSGQHKYKVPLKSDVWSLGCILYNMVYGKTPFQHITNQYSKMLAIIGSGAQRKIAFAAGPNARVIDVMKMCLQRDVKTRPSVDELLRHPYAAEQTGGGAAVDDARLLTLGAAFGQNTPRTNARMLKQLFSTVQSGGDV